MARKRLISPEFFTHGALYDAEAAAGLPLRLAFAGLWTQADKRGRFEWKPRVLKLAIMPYDAVDFDAILRALRGAGFVECYVVGGKEFGVIPSFAQWQTFHAHEKESKFPDPPEPTIGVPATDIVGSSPTVTVAVTGTVSIAGADAVPPRAGDHVTAFVREFDFGRFADAVEGFLRSQRNPVAIMAILRFHLSGEGGYLYATAAQVGSACLQYASGGKEFSAVYFAAFLPKVQISADRAARKANNAAEQSTIERENKNRQRADAEADAADKMVRDYERAHPAEYAALLAGVEKTVPENIQAGRDVMIRAQLATLIRREAA